MELQKALEYLVTLGQEQEQSFRDDMENVYVSTDYKRVLPDRPEPIITGTLTSVVAYIKANIKEVEDPIIHVEDYSTVAIYSTLDDYEKRNCYLKAKALVPEVLRYGNFYETENFNIALQARFVPTPDRDTLLKISGNITESAVKTSVDDGVSQSVAVKTGVTTVANTPVPKIVKLKPFRTFTEIEQPESEFVFRIKEGPTCAIFEADGGAWKNQCIQDIAKYLEYHLSDSSTDIVILA